MQYLHIPPPRNIHNINSRRFTGFLVQCITLTQNLTVIQPFVIKTNTIDRLEYLPIVFAFITVSSFLPNRNTTSTWTSHLTFVHIPHLQQDIQDSQVLPLTAPQTDQKYYYFLKVQE